MSKPKPRASAPARPAEKQPSTPKFYDGPTVSNLDKSRRKSSPAGSAPLATKSDALVKQPAKQPVTVSVTTTRKPKPRRKGWTLWGIITVLPLLLFASLWSVVLCPPPNDQPSSFSQFALGTLGLKVQPEESSLHKTLCYPANVYHREVLVPYVYPAIEDVKAKVSASSLYRDTLEPGYNAASSHAQRIWNGPLKPVVDRTARGANKLHRAYVAPHVPYVKAKFTEATAPLRLRMCAMYKEHLAPHVHVIKHHACAATKQMRATFDHIMGHPATAQAGKHAHSAYLFGKHHGGRAYEYSKPHAIWAYNEGSRHARDTVLPRTRQALNAAGKQLCATYSVLKAHAAKVYNEHLAEHLDPYVTKVNAAVAPYCKMFNRHVYRPYLQPVVHHFFPPQSKSKGFWSYVSDFVPAAGSTVGNRDGGKKIDEDVKANAKKATDAAAKKAADVKKQAEAKVAAEKKEAEAKAAAEKKKAEAKSASLKKEAESKTRDAERAAKTAAQGAKKQAEDITAAGKSKARDAASAAETVAQEAKGATETIVQDGKQKVFNAEQTASAAGTAATDAAKKAASAGATTAYEAVKSATESAKSAADKASASAESAAKAASKGAESAASSVSKGAESAASSASKGAGSAASSVSKGAESAASSVSKGAGSAASSASKGGESAVSSASKGAESAATSASKGAESAADATVNTKADVHAKIALLKKKIDFQGKALYSRVQSDTLKNAEHFFTLTKDIQRIGEDNLKREIDRMIQGLDRLYSNSRALTWEQLEESQSMSDTKVIKILDQVKKGVKVKMNHVFEQSKPAVEKAQQDIEAVLGDEYTNLGERMRGIEGINRKDWDAYKGLKRDVEAWKTKLAEAPEKPATRELKQALQKVHTEGNDVILYFNENYEEWKDRQTALRRQAAERIQAREALEGEGKPVQIPRAQPKKDNEAKKQAILNQEVPVKAAFITKEPGEQVKTHHVVPTEKAKAKQQDNE